MSRLADSRSSGASSPPIDVRIQPGLIDTELHATVGMPDRVERAARHLPMKRAGSAEEVAEAILWLASTDASYVSGSILDVSGAR